MNQDRKKLEKFGPKTSVAYALLQSNATIHITKERRGDEVRSGPENMKRCQNEKLQRKKKEFRSRDSNPGLSGESQVS